MAIVPYECMKTLASVPVLVVEAHGQESLNKEYLTGKNLSCVSCVKKALNRHIFIVGYLPYVDRKLLLAALS